MPPTDPMTPQRLLERLRRIASYHQLPEGASDELRQIADQLERNAMVCLERRKDAQISALQQQIARLTALNNIAASSMKFSKETIDSLKLENEALGIRLAKAMGAKIEEQS